MNYAYIDDGREQESYLEDLISTDETLEINKFLGNYKKIKQSLEVNRIMLSELEKQKKEIDNYNDNLFIKHQKVMIYLIKEEDESKDINDKIVSYMEKTKEISEKWEKNYYKRIKTKLQINIQKEENEIEIYNKLFIKTTKEIIKEDKIDKKLCPICFDNEIDMCAYPCGHTCCNTCVLQTINYNNSKRCLSCRNDIKHYIKIYFLI
jgi:hypothetical protein